MPAHFMYGERGMRFRRTLRLTDTDTLEMQCPGVLLPKRLQSLKGVGVFILNYPPDHRLPFLLAFLSSCRSIAVVQPSHQDMPSSGRGSLQSRSVPLSQLPPVVSASQQRPLRSRPG